MIKTTIVLALAALLAVPALQAGVLEENVIRSDWFSLGGELRVRQEGFNNIITWDSDNLADQQNYMRVRTRLFAQALPWEGVKAYARLVNEWRHYFKPRNRVHPLRDEILLDSANLSLWDKDLGLELTVGRQDLIYGEGFLILDGTPLDGSRSIFSDLAKLRVTLAEKTTLDFLGMYNTGKQWFAIHRNTDPLSAVDSYRLDSQEIGIFGAYLTDKTLLEAQQIELYYLFKYGKVSDVAPELFPQNQISVFGGRFSGPLVDKFCFAAEATGQLGSYGGEPQQAFGGYANLTYRLTAEEDMPVSVTLGAVYLSGDDPDTSNHEGWDPILASWPKWSELYCYSFIPEKDVAYWSNIQIYRAQLNLSPVDRFQVELVYQFFRANEASDAPWSGGGKDRGQNPQVLLKYAFTDWLDCHLLGEYFIPGNFYASDDNGFFARWEILGRF